MKNFKVFSTLLLVLLISIISNAQQTFKTTSKSVIGYLEYLPQGYNTNSNKYPIVIFLHGLGERGVNSKDPATLQTTISLVAKNGPPKHVNAGTQFPFILISPQLKDNWTDWPVSYVIEVIDYCKTYLRVDEKQIYLTGLSLGGGGTWSTAQNYASLFAAVAPLCGSRNDQAKAINIASENLPVWAFHGDADTTVPYNRSVAMVNKINSCTPVPSPLAKMTLYPGVGHNCWDNGYQPNHTIHNPNVYEWMMSYKNVKNGTNMIPEANAGADLVKGISDGNITISASASADVDGTIASYAWTQLSGPTTATLTNATTATVKVTNVALGDYFFKVTVTDNSGETSFDYVKLTIQPSVNIAPVALAGADTIVSLPVASVMIEGAGIDSDGSVISYQWTKVSGDAGVVLNGASSADLTASSLVAGTYTFQLTVTDDKGASSQDQVSLVVNPATGGNIAPIVTAGPDKVIKLPTYTCTLFGSASDSDGTIASYKWTQLSGGVCTFSSTTVSQPKLTNLVSGVYSFRLTVTDNQGATSSDDMVVVVDVPAVVDAGIDYTITLPTSAVVLTGVATDADGTITTYAWTKYSGPTATLTNKDQAAVTITKLLEGTYVFKLTVTDDAGVTSYDYATVTVLPATTTARTSTPEESIKAVEETEVAPEFALSAADETTNVVVYNANGEKVYHGTWNADSFNTVFSQRGMYVYQMVKNGKKTSGKVFKN